MIIVAQSPNFQEPSSLVLQAHKKTLETKLILYSVFLGVRFLKNFCRNRSPSQIRKDWLLSFFDGQYSLVCHRPRTLYYPRIITIPLDLIVK